MFVSKTYTRPDIAGHDAMLTSTVQSSPVLFIRGTDPVYISVEASNYTGNCSHNFEIVVKEGETFAGILVMYDDQIKTVFLQQIIEPS